MTAARAAGTGVALLGYGAIADMHAAALRRAGARLLRVAGPKRAEAERFATRHAVAAVAASPEDAIAAEGIEVVVVASPSPIHSAQARYALEAGRHVLVEIPLAFSVDEGESLVALAARQGLVLGVCHTLRFWDPFRHVQAAIAAGRVRPRHVVARALSRRRENVGWTGRRRSWTDDLLWHQGGHVIDATLGFLSSPVADVRATAGPVWGGSGKPMDYAITLRTEDGGIGSLALSYNASIGASDYVLIGEDETLTIAGAEVRDSRATLVSGDVAAVQKRAVDAQDAAFLAAIRGGAPFPAEAPLILPTLRVQQAVDELVRQRS